MEKKDIYELISNKDIPVELLAKRIKIEDFVGGLDIIDKEKKITYGVNVRLSRETDISVYPFNYNSKRFKAEQIAEKVTRGYKVPDFLHQFGLQEIIFRVDYNKVKDNEGNDIINIIEIEDKKIEKNPFVKNRYHFNEDGNNGEILRDVFFSKCKHTFLHENILALFPPIPYSPSSTFAYVWARGEDPDVTTGDGRFLTHILVISDDSNKFDKFIEDTKMNFMEFVIMLKSRKLYDADIIQRKEAIKSAKAAIMSRNMSHNLGSHVMSYLKTNLSSVKSILKDNVMSVLLEGKELNLELISSQHIDTNNLTLPFLVGLGRFISYLQERQDYIATVSTDYIPYCSSVNFKDFIYDELNSDKRYERHPDRTNLKPDNILLGNIARSEGLGRQTSPTKPQASPTKGESTLRDIVLKFRTSFDGTPPGDNHIAQAELDQMRNYELSLPGGIVGRQAIFSIIENVIRNAAKHGNWREQGKLELTLDIFTKEDVENNQPDDELKKRLLDNDRPDDGSLSLKGVLEKFYCGKGSYNYYFITLTDNLISNANSLKELRKALHEEYVDHDNRMIETNKGIKEMRISAAWLRSTSNDLALSPFNESNNGKGELKWDNAKSNWDKRPPILYVRLSKDSLNQCHLQYIFCVLRPKKVAFVSSSFANKNKKTKNIDGYFFLSPKEYIKFPNKNFEFVVYDDKMKNAYKHDMLVKKTKKEKTAREDDTRLFEDAEKRFKREKKKCEKVRRHSSQRFILLSNLSKEKNVIEDIKTLVIDINIIKEMIEIKKNRIDEFTEEHKKKTEELKKKTEELKKKTEEVYPRLYMHFSGWDGEEKILIDDNDKSSFDKEKKSLLESDAQESAHEVQDESKNDKETQLSSDKLTFNPEDENIKYRFIKHLEEKVEFEKYIIKDNKHYEFSEGITGDNSTDRLVRKEPKTELWFFKQLHAMKEKIAIFDERIFSKVTGLDESDFVSLENCWGKDLEADKVSLIAQNELSDDIIDEINMFETHENLEEYIVNMNLKKPDDKINNNLNSVDTHNHLGATYKYKNLHVFSIMPVTENSEWFYLYGIKIDKSKNTFSRCVRYATLSWENGRLIINNDAQQRTDWMKFHSLSIHQGLLDKMYDAFGIKKADIDSKEKLTKDLYEHFIIDAKAQEIKFMDEKNLNQLHFFLPGMTIHSGRSKPSKEDMPQKLPFIPYSAIEHAVRDCKYSIVELLDSARYE